MSTPRSPLWKIAGRIARVGFEAIAYSIRSFKPLLDTSLPTVLEKLDKSIELGGGSYALILCSNGSGTVFVDGEPWWCIDCVNSFTPLKPGGGRVRVVVEPRGVFGAHHGRLYVMAAGVAGVSWPILRLGLRLLHVARLVSKGFLEARAVGELESLLTEVDVEPEPWMLAAAYTGLRCPADPMCPRRDEPEYSMKYTAVSSIKYLSRGWDAGRDAGFEGRAGRLYKRVAEIVAEGLRGILDGAVVHLVFYSHLDTPWLWPLEWSRDRARCQAATMRSIYTLYPELTIPYHPGPFLASMWARGLLPARDRIARLCSMYVEPDLWTTPGHLLAEMVLECSGGLLWLPDSFGYPSSLPKMVRVAGLQGVAVYKILWSDRFKPDTPYTLWLGDDGSTVPAYIPPTYAGSCSPADILEKTRVFRYVSRGILYSCSLGDSGTPPTLEDVEGALLAVEAGVAVPLDVDRLLADSGRPRAYLAGDLYLEYHRGAYTTDTPTKTLLHVLARLLAVYELLEAAGYGVNVEGLRRTAMLLSFHDTASGTLSGEARRSVWEKALEALGMVRLGGRCLVNTLAWTARLLVFGERGPKAYTAEPLTVQPLGEPTDIPVERLGDTLASGAVEAKPAGDKLQLGIQGRRVTISLRIHHDKPHAWDAWEVDEYSLYTAEEVEASTIVGRSQVALKASGSWGRGVIVARPAYDRVVVDVYVEPRRRGRLVKLWIELGEKPGRILRGVPLGASDTIPVEKDEAWYEQPAHWLYTGSLAVAFNPPRGVTLYSGRIGVSVTRSPLYPNPGLSPRAHTRIVFSLARSPGDAARLYEELDRPPQPVGIEPCRRARLLEVEATRPPITHLYRAGGRIRLVLFNPEEERVTVTLKPALIVFNEVKVRSPSGTMRLKPGQQLEIGPRGLLVAELY